MNTNRAEYLIHNGVMESEVSDLVNDVPDGLFVDATYGYGSHFSIFEQNNKNLKFIGFDRDIEAIDHANSQHNVNHLVFSKIPEFLKKLKVSEISGIFYDFGLSSHQIDTANRGFSFQTNSNLDMRMDQTQKISAEQILNLYSFEELKNIIYKFGEEKYANKISDLIIKNRPIKSTFQLTKIIQDSIPKQNPIYIKKTIRRVFQAIRIETNNELLEIEESLEGTSKMIVQNGVIICISYHSLEDKIVKNFFNLKTSGCKCDPKYSVCICNISPEFKFGKFKKKKPSLEEQSKNPRSKSAVLRYVVKT